MRVVIVEDEVAASDNLSHLLKEIDRSIEIVKVIDSVSSSVSFFTENSEYDLVFMDIHLGDGLSFEIFQQITIDKPIIFTTAYDQYTLQAFKVNSIDYLLKPIDPDELSEAIAQFKKLEQSNSSETVDSKLEGLLSLLSQKEVNYKTTYLVHQRDELLPIKTSEIAFVFIEVGIVKIQTFDGNQYILDKKLEDVEQELDPKTFFRVNRQFVVNREAVKSVKFYFNGKLILNTNPSTEERIVVSRAKAGELKKWINS